MTETTAIYDTTSYRWAVTVVDRYIQARLADALPDHKTERVLGMRGPLGQTLYGAFQTLHIHGRLSRTMLEQALCSPYYPEFVLILLRSLFPDERSMYAADIYNSKPPVPLTWDDQIYKRLQQGIQKDGFQAAPRPCTPLGDNRHAPLQAKIVAAVGAFFSLFKHGVLFECGCRGDDWYAPLNSDYFEANDNVLTKFGPYFGIHKNELHAERQTPEEMSESDVLLRTFNVLYVCERLCKTELECALLQGREALQKLVTHGIHLTQHGWPQHVNARPKTLLKRASKIDWQTIPVTPVVATESDEVFVECDYCGDVPTKRLRCSQCHCAMYCSQKCQKNDRKRHKPLCHLYTAQQTEAPLGQSPSTPELGEGPAASSQDLNRLGSAAETAGFGTTPTSSDPGIFHFGSVGASSPSFETASDETFTFGSFLVGNDSPREESPPPTFAPSPSAQKGSGFLLGQGGQTRRRNVRAKRPIR